MSTKDKSLDSGMNQGGNSMPKLKRTICNLLLCVLLVTQVMTGIPTVQAASTPTELESITVSGGKFDTGIKINQAYSLQMTFSLSTLNQYKNLFYSDAYTLRQEASNGLYIRHGWYNEKVFTPTVNKDVTILQKKNTTYVNGTKVMTATLQSITSAETLKFGDLSGAIKEFKIWNSGDTLVADYIPALDASKKACMYDKVTKKYVYYSGTCTAGKQVNKTETSTGTNTGSSVGSVTVPNTGSSAGSSTGTNTGSSSNTIPEIKVEVNNNVQLQQSAGSSSGTINYVGGLKLNGGTFDTNIKMNQDYSVEIAFTLSTLNQYRNLYSSNVHTLRNEATNGLYAKHGWYNDKVYVPKVNEEVVVLQKKNVTYVNDVKKQNATYQSMTDSTVLSFGNFLGTIASFRVWNEKGTLIAEYLPALDKSNKACMYDTVNKKYVYYSGTCTVTGEEVSGDTTVSKPANGSSSNTNSSTTTPTKTAYNLLKDAMLNSNSSKLDVSGYKLTEAELRAIWADMTEDYYIEFVAHGYIRLIVYTSNGYAKSCEIYGIESGYSKRLNAVKKSFNEVLSQVDNKMTDVDKVLLVHEYIIENTEYSTAKGIYGYAAGPLGEGYGLCAGYADAMIVLLHYMDIEAYTVVSTEMNHGWLYVKLDGKYYHIDPTWDDSQKGTDDMYQHRFLLRNDDEFNTIAAARAHYNWKSYQVGNVTANSTRFKNWYVHDVAGKMFYHDGMWYFWDRNTNSIKCANITGTTMKTVIDGSKISEKLKIKSIENNILYYYKGSTLCKKSI